MWLVLASLAAANAAPVLIAPPGVRTRLAEPPKFDSTAAPGRCLVRVMIDEGGVPIQVEPRSCPPVYATAASEAVRGWRWDPILTPDKQPAQAVFLVAIAFTGRGRIAVPPAPRCTYTLRILPDGMVRTEGDRAPQCEIWPPLRVASSAPAAGTCSIGVNPTVPQDNPGWIDVSTCAEGVYDLAAEVVGGSLFAAGTESTRFVLVLPEVVARPTNAVTTFDIPSPGVEQAPTRLGGATGAAAADPTLAVPTTSVPKVDLSALRDRAKAPKPAPAPVPEEPEEKAPPPP
jgi:hypothetical protein